MPILPDYGFFMRLRIVFLARIRIFLVITWQPWDYVCTHLVSVVYNVMKHISRNIFHRCAPRQNFPEFFKGPESWSRITGGGREEERKVVSFHS